MHQQTVFMTGMSPCSNGIFCVLNTSKFLRNLFVKYARIRTFSDLIFLYKKNEGQKKYVHWYISRGEKFFIFCAA